MKNLITKWREITAYSALLTTTLLFQACVNDEVVSPTSVGALSSQSSVALANVPEPCMQTCLVAGQNTQVGTVDVVVLNNGDLSVTYKIVSPDVYLNEIHLDIFKSIEQFTQDKKVSKGGAVPGKFSFKNAWSTKEKVSTYTVRIPKAYIDGKSLGSSCIYVAAHASLSNGETAWAGMCDTSNSSGELLYKAKQFPGANWSVYFDFCLDACNSEIDFSYAWEDLQGSNNDADYNDLVIQSDVVRTYNSLELNFTATARGAVADHQFKFKIPKAGITSISGASSYYEEGNFYIVTVFESTKKAVPSKLTGIFDGIANTYREFPCSPFGSKKIVLTTDNQFAYNKAKPYEPFISVFLSGRAGEGSSYDLYVYDISGPSSGTWVKGGKEYPNGIMIPKDWKWPLERIPVYTAYPKFTSLTEGFTTDWASFLVYPENTFDTNACK